MAIECPAARMPRRSRRPRAQARAARQRPRLPAPAFDAMRAGHC
ncbi:hypothetical protein [Lysobacter gummosus]